MRRSDGRSGPGRCAGYCVCLELRLLADHERAERLLGGFTIETYQRTDKETETETVGFSLSPIKLLWAINTIRDQHPFKLSKIALSQRLVSPPLLNRDMVLVCARRKGRAFA
jgi:hypothetical protein